MRHDERLRVSHPQEELRQMRKVLSNTESQLRKIQNFQVSHLQRASVAALGKSFSDKLVRFLWLVQAQLRQETQQTKAREDRNDDLREELQLLKQRVTDQQVRS